MKLMSFIKTLLPHLHKNDILEDSRITISELEQIVIPIVRQAKVQFPLFKPKSTANKDILNVFFRNCKFAEINRKAIFRDTSSLFVDLDKALEIVLENIKFATNELDKNATEDIFTSSISNTKAIAIRAIDQISFISSFTVDFISVLYSNEAKEVKEAEHIDMSKSTTKRVDINISVYGQLLEVYGDTKSSLAVRFENIPEVILNESTADSILNTYGESKIDPVGPGTTNFTYNPIYHIGLVVAEWQADRYKNMKDKKKMLEFRLIHLQMLEDNASNPKIEEEIAYIQNRIDKLEYKINKMES